MAEAAGALASVEQHSLLGADQTICWWQTAWKRSVGHHSPSRFWFFIIIHLIIVPGDLERLTNLKNVCQTIENCQEVCRFDVGEVLTSWTIKHTKQLLWFPYFLKQVKTVSWKAPAFCRYRTRQSEETLFTFLRNLTSDVPAIWGKWAFS